MNFKWKCKCGIREFILEEVCEICGEKFIKWYDVMKKKPKLDIYEYVVKENENYNYCSFGGLIKKFTKILEEIPKEYRDNTMFDICKFYKYGDDCIGINIFYKRLETDEEYELRIEKEEELKKDKEREERILFENLKKKYEKG